MAYVGERSNDFGKFLQRIFNRPQREKRLLTLDDSAGWSFKNFLFGGTLKQATQLPTVKNDIINGKNNGVLNPQDRAT